MKNTLLAAALFAASLFAVPAMAQEAKQDFDLVNRTGYEIKAVFVAPSKSDDWEEDILGDETLEEGETFHLRFSRANKTCLWDMKVVYEDDDSIAVWKEIDLCKVSKITIRYSKSTDTTSATFD